MKDKVFFESLEERVMMTASPMDLQPAIHAPAIMNNLAQEAEGIAIDTLLIVDTSVKNYEALIDELQKPGLEIYFLDANENGIQQIAEILKNYQEIESLHILSHASEGTVSLGNSSLRNETLSQYEELISQWSSAFTDNADILFYGCELASDNNGQKLIENLATITGTDIAASDDITGYGGDIDLEYKTGKIEAEVLLSQDSFDRANVNLKTIEVTVDPAGRLINNAGIGQGADSFTDLEEIIDAANDHDIIQFKGSVKVDFLGSISLDKNLTLQVEDGHTVELNGMNTNRIFELSGNVEVTLRGFNFVDGTETHTRPFGRGGAIRVTDDASLNIFDSTFLNNQSTRQDGGAISFESEGQLTVMNSRFENNAAGNQDRDRGGAIFLSKGSFKITGNTFINNIDQTDGVPRHNDLFFNRDVELDSFVQDDAIIERGQNPLPRLNGLTNYSIDQGQNLAIQHLNIPHDLNAIVLKIEVQNGSLHFDQALLDNLTNVIGINGGSSIELVGPNNRINAALASLVYKGNNNFSGSESLSFELSDNGSDPRAYILYSSEILVNAVPQELNSAKAFIDTNLLELRTQRAEAIRNFAFDQNPLKDFIQEIASPQLFNFISRNNDLFVNIELNEDFLRSIERVIYLDTALDTEIAENEEGFEYEQSFYELDQLQPEQIKFIESLIKEIQDYEENLEKEEEVQSSNRFDVFSTRLVENSVQHPQPSMAMSDLDERRSLNETLNESFQLFS